MHACASGLHQPSSGLGNSCRCSQKAHAATSSCLQDGSFQVSIFVDQLALSRRPSEDDRALLTSDESTGLSLWWRGSTWTRRSRAVCRWLSKDILVSFRGNLHEVRNLPLPETYYKLQSFLTLPGVFALGLGGLGQGTHVTLVGHCRVACPVLAARFAGFLLC